MNTISNQKMDSTVEGANVSLLQTEENEVKILTKRDVLTSGALNINKETINFTSNVLSLSLNTDDVIGCDILEDDIKVVSKEAQEAIKGNAILRIDLIPLYKYKESSCCSTKDLKNRKFKSIEIILSKPKAVQHYEQLSKYCNKHLSFAKIETDLGISISKKRLLVFLNPFGGKGVAIKIWNSVKDIFENSFFEIEVFKTQRYMHAYDHILTIDKDKYHGIVCNSGDGIIHEVTNAMKKRQSKGELDFDIPLGVIPAGSGNALAQTIIHEAGEVEANPIALAYQILSGKTRKIDLMEIEFLSKPEKVYSFLSVVFAIVADIDLESEM